MNMRARPDRRQAEPAIPERVGMTAVEIEDMYPPVRDSEVRRPLTSSLAHREVADNLEERQGGCGLDFAGGPGSCGPGHDSGELPPRATSTW